MTFDKISWSLPFIFWSYCRKAIATDRNFSKELFPRHWAMSPMHKCFPKKFHEIDIGKCSIRGNAQLDWKKQCRIRGTNIALNRKRMYFSTFTENNGKCVRYPKAYSFSYFIINILLSGHLTKEVQILLLWKTHERIHHVFYIIKLLSRFKPVKFLIIS